MSGRATTIWGFSACCQRDQASLLSVNCRGSLAKYVRLYKGVGKLVVLCGVGSASWSNWIRIRIEGLLHVSCQDIDNTKADECTM